ncbi:MAG: hypothetical protein [Caudoviricetes sp.]|nr:MAG: hypothetical protein [Caudoviricetes sp.]
MKTNILAYVIRDMDEYGIRIVNAEWDENNPDWISFSTKDSNFKQYAVGADWFKTEEEARVQLERVRTWRIEIKERELQSIKDKIFEVRDER